MYYDAMQNEVTFYLKYMIILHNMSDVVSPYNEAHQHVVEVEVVMMDVAMLYVQHPYHK